LKILFLAKRRYTNKDAFRERFGRVYQLPLHWAKAGHNVELALLDYRGMRGLETSTDGFLAKTIPMANARSPFRLRAQARAFRPDVVVASGDCFVGFAGLHLAKAIKTRFVFDVYDDYSSFGAYRAFLGWDAMGKLIRRSDHCFYASHFLAHHNSFGARHAVVPNGVDSEIFHPIAMKSARAQIGIEDPDAKLIGYFGSMESDRGIDDLITAVGQLHGIDPSIRLLLCGRPTKNMRLLPDWADYRGSVPHTSIPDYLNACNVVTLPYRRSQMMDMGASCKIAEYLLCNRPLAATSTPNLVANFPKQAAELDQTLSRPSDPIDLARVIASQLQQPRIVSRPEEHTWRVISKNALTAINDMIIGDPKLNGHHPSRPPSITSLSNS
jgi:glycosyltransferase involved in cell wall biosynthesis